MILNIEDNPLSKEATSVFPFFSWNFNEVGMNRWWDELYYEIINLNKNSMFKYKFIQCNLNLQLKLQ